TLRSSATSRSVGVTCSRDCRSACAYRGFPTSTWSDVSFGHVSDSLTRGDFASAIREVSRGVVNVTTLVGMSPTHHTSVKSAKLAPAGSRLRAPALQHTADASVLDAQETEAYRDGSARDDRARREAAARLSGL